jgi:excisionase family DNA binding protein
LGIVKKWSLKSRVSLGNKTILEVDTMAKKITNGPLLVTVTEAAKVLRVSRKTVYQWLKKGVIRKSGTPQVRIPQSEIDRIARPVGASGR